MSVLFFLLCSGCFHLTFAVNRLRDIRFLGYEGDWSEALNECDKTGESLITLYDQQDADFGMNFIKNTSTLKAWIGIHNQINATTWSNGDKYILNDSNVNIEQGKQICEAFEDGVRKGFNCSDRKPFMCQKDNDYTLINKERNWCQALQYCRTHLSNLASISDDQQNEHLKNKSLSSPESKTFWIGLLHDEWRWADKSCSTYRSLTGGRIDKKCAFLFNAALSLTECNQLAAALCSKGSVRIVTVRDPLSWEEALNYCEAKYTRLLWIEDKDDQKAVEQWLKHTSNENQKLWIGLRQSSVFGFWIWSDRIVNWNNWRKNQIPELSLAYSHCGVISVNGTWSAEDCRKAHPFLCEEDISYMDE